MTKELERPGEGIKVTDPAIFRYGVAKGTPMNQSQLLKHAMTSREQRRRAERQARRNRKRGKP